LPYIFVYEAEESLAMGVRVCDYCLERAFYFLQVGSRRSVYEEDDEVCLFDVAVPNLSVVLASGEVPKGVLLLVCITIAYCARARTLFLEQQSTVQTHGRLDLLSFGEMFVELTLKLVNPSLLMRGAYALS